MNVTTLGISLIVSFLRLYKSLYVVFVSRLGKYSKRSICAFLWPMAKFLCNSTQFRLHVEPFKLDMINLACGVIRISIKCSCLEIFDQQESFKLDMIDLTCGVIRISNKVLLLRYSINKVIRILPPLQLIPYHIIWYPSFRLKIGYMFPLRFFSICFLSFQFLIDPK